MRSKEYLKNNPYRVLGVATTDSPATRMQRQSRIKAFASIGKTVTFPMDLFSVYGSHPERDEAAISAARSLLSTPKDRLLHGMFWFMNLTATDAEALAVLFETGNLLEVRRMWEQAEQNMSAVQNQLVCCLLMDPRAYAKALQLAYELYTHFGYEFITTLCGGVQVVTPDRLMPLFMEVVTNFAGSDSSWWDKAVKRCNNAAIDNHWAEAKAGPLIAQLQVALNIARSTECHTPQHHFDIATRLMKQAEPFLKPLKALAATHPQLYSRYATITDTVAETVLDHEIEYSLRTDWYIKKSERCMVLMCFCYRYACTVRFKNRCQKNINIVLGRLENAPLFPNGQPDNLILEVNRQKRNDAICAIVSALEAAQE